MSLSPPTLCASGWSREEKPTAPVPLLPELAGGCSLRNAGQLRTQVRAPSSPSPLGPSPAVPAPGHPQPLAVRQPRSPLPFAGALFQRGAAFPGGGGERRRRRRGGGGEGRRRFPAPLFVRAEPRFPGAEAGEGLTRGAGAARGRAAGGGGRGARPGSGLGGERARARRRADAGEGGGEPGLAAALGQGLRRYEGPAELSPAAPHRGKAAENRPWISMVAGTVWITPP